MKKYELTIKIQAENHTEAIAIANALYRPENIVQLKPIETDKDSILYMENIYKKLYEIMGVPHTSLNNIANTDLLQHCNTCKYLDTTTQLMSYPPQYKCSNPLGIFSVRCTDINQYGCNHHAI